MRRRERLKRCRRHLFDSDEGICPDGETVGLYAGELPRVEVQFGELKQSLECLSQRRVDVNFPVK